MAIFCAASMLFDAQAQTAEEDNIPWAQNSPYAPRNKMKKTPPPESAPLPPPEKPPQSPADAKALEPSLQNKKQQAETPRTSKGIFYLSGGGMALAASSGREENPDFYRRRLGGASLGIGGVSSRNHYLGLDIGIYGGSLTERTIPGGVTSYSYVSDLLVVPVHLTYNYFAYFDDAQRVRFRFGPSAGLTLIRNSEEENYYSRYEWRYSSVKKSKASISGGVEVGLAWQVSETVYFDIGYRLSAFKSPMLNKSIVLGTNLIDTGGSKSFLNHQVGISLGFRF
jgi:opacity protein-like surface antigen